MRSLATALSFVGACALVVACPSCSSKSGGKGFTDDTQPSGGFGNGDDGGTTTGSMPSGTPVDVTPPCDSSLAVDGDATAFAKAIGICKNANADGFGLVSAVYSKAYGSATPPVNGQWGLLPKFGDVIKPREGGSFGALSSGYAREYDDLTGGMTEFAKGQPLYGNSTAAGAVPMGFPKAALGCDQDGKVNDMIDVKLTLRAPMDAAGFQFDFNFYSSEWPDYVCSNYNDAFIAYVTSNQVKDNVSFDSNNNPVAVNNDFLNRCTPNTSVGCSTSKGAGSPIGSPAACMGGESELQGTGFGPHATTGCNMKQLATVGGSTGWLTTQAPVDAGETFTIDFMIFDAGDEALDSVVLIDNFQWLGGTVSTGTSRVK
jgi:hypothetical protein